MTTFFTKLKPNTWSGFIYLCLLIIASILVCISFTYSHIPIGMPITMIGFSICLFSLYLNDIGYIKYFRDSATANIGFLIAIIGVITCFVAAIT